MLPLHDNVPTRSFPLVTVSLIVANTLVFLWEITGTPADQDIYRYSYYPCAVDGPCVGPAAAEHLPFWAGTFTAMFMHAGWGHFLGNMLFLWIFGNNVEDALGRVRFLVFYALSGLAATALQTFVTLGWGSDAEAMIPNLGASGAIAAVLGGYILLHPGGSVLTWIAPIFFFSIPAVIYLGLWFAFQLVEGGYAFTHPQEGGGVAYFAHIGGFLFGLLAIKLFQSNRRPVRGY